MKYHFKTSTGEVIQSNNLDNLRKRAYLEPRNYVTIHRQDGWKTKVMGAKQHLKYIIKKSYLLNAKAESLIIAEEQ